MKILILIPADAMGGAEQYLNMVASYYKDATVDIHFLSLLGKDFWKNSNTYSNIYFPESNINLINIVKFIFNPKHKNNKYDYIFTSHVYTTGLVGIMLRLNLIRASKFIARESTSIFLRYRGMKLLSYKLFYWLGYKKVDLLICQTDLMKQQLIEGFPRIMESTTIKVMPNPIDISLIEEKENLPFNEVLPSNFIVTAGRLIHEKGYDLLITALAQLKGKYPDLKLIILGYGDLKHELINLATSLNIEKDVLFWGFVENVYPFFKKANACVVSSRVEGFPNVLLQMMSQNSNVVSTTCAGGIDTIPGIHIAETNSTQSLFDAIDNALESKSDNRPLFDNFLKKRDISSFIAQINQDLYSQTKFS